MEENTSGTKYFINGKEYTQQEFEKAKQEFQAKKITLVESGQNSFKTRLND